MNKLVNNFYKKYRETILMNKNLLIAGIFGFLVSAAIAEIYAIYSPSNVLTSTITSIGRIYNLQDIIYSSFSY